jgi:hypothetical protein
MFVAGHELQISLSFRISNEQSQVGGLRQPGVSESELSAITFLPILS